MEERWKVCKVIQHFNNFEFGDFGRGGGGGAQFFHNIGLKVSLWSCTFQ